MVRLNLWRAHLAVVVCVLRATTSAPTPGPTPACPITRDFCVNDPTLEDNCNCGDCGYPVCGDCDCDHYGDEQCCTSGYGKETLRRYGDLTKLRACLTTRLREARLPTDLSVPLIQPPTHLPACRPACLPVCQHVSRRVCSNREVLLRWQVRDRLWA